MIKLLKSAKLFEYERNWGFCHWFWGNAEEEGRKDKNLDP